MNFDAIQLETSRIRLRKLDQNDSEDILKIYSDALTMQYWSCVPYISINQASELISRAIQAWNSGNSICFALECKESKQVIGTQTVYSFHEESRRAEIGYILLRSHWSKGIMTEVLETVIEYLFNSMKLNRLEADIDPENISSVQLVKKLGFVLEGRLRERWIVDGRATDSDVYGLLNRKT